MARLLELLDEGRERLRPGRAVALGLPDLLRAVIPGHDLVIRVAQDPVHHVAAHLAQPNEPDLHQTIPLILAVSCSTPAAGSPSSRTPSAGRPCARSVCRSPVACAFFSVPNV